MPKEAEKLLKALSDADTQHEMVSIIENVRYICLFRQISCFVMGFTGAPINAGDTKKFLEYVVKESDNLEEEEYKKAIDILSILKKEGNSIEDVYSSIEEQEELLKLASEYYGFKEQRVDEL